MKRVTYFLIVAVFSVASTGCAMWQSASSAMVDSTRMFRPRPHDGSQIPEDDEDEWSFVGDEVRGQRARERDPDRWWRDLVMSQEARNIESNLGID